MIAAFLIAASVATPNPQSVTIGYEEVVALARDADALCPLVHDDRLDANEKGLRFKKVMSENDYSGPKFALLNLMCGQWTKGYVEGARRKPK